MGMAWRADPGSWAALQAVSRNRLDGLFYLVRTDRQLRHQPPPPAFPPWPVVYGYMWASSVGRYEHPRGAGSLPPGSSWRSCGAPGRAGSSCPGAASECAAAARRAACRACGRGSRCGSSAARRCARAARPSTSASMSICSTASTMLRRLGRTAIEAVSCFRQQLGEWQSVRGHWVLGWSGAGASQFHPRGLIDVDGSHAGPDLRVWAPEGRR